MKRQQLDKRSVGKVLGAGQEVLSLGIEQKEERMVGLTRMVNESLARHGIPVQLASARNASVGVQPPSAEAGPAPESSNKQAQIGPPAPLPNGF